MISTTLLYESPFYRNNIYFDGSCNYTKFDSQVENAIKNKTHQLTWDTWEEGEEVNCKKVECIVPTEIINIKLPDYSLFPPKQLYEKLQIDQTIVISGFNEVIFSYINNQSKNIDMFPISKEYNQYFPVYHFFALRIVDKAAIPQFIDANAKEELFYYINLEFITDL